MIKPGGKERLINALFKLKAVKPRNHPLPQQRY